MKRIITLLLLFFVLIFNKAVNAQSESVYVHDFHITESSDLTTSEQSQIDKTIGRVKEYLKATLKGDYKVLPDKASNMLTTDLQDIEVSYRDDADYMVFGRVAYDKDSEYLILSIHLYEILNRDYLKERKMYTSEGEMSVWNTKEGKLEKIDEIQKNVFPNIRNNELDEERTRIAKQKERELEEERIRIAKQKEAKRIQREKELEEERIRIAKQKARERIQKERELEEERIRIAKQKEAKRIQGEKEEEEKCTKKERRQNMLKNIPAIGLMAGGAVMGGKGIQLRIQALKLYDDYDDAVAADVSNTNGILDDMLEDARKPNRRAHIIGVGGVLVGSVGVYLWINRNRRNKKVPYTSGTATQFPKVKIEPHIEYNIGSNTNTVHAKMTYTF